MSEFFEATYKYRSIDEESGKTETVTDVILMDSNSFTETEARVTEKCNGLTFKITKIQPVVYADIHLKTDEDESYYKALVIIKADEGKPIKDNYLVASDNPTSVEKFIHELFRGSPLDIEVTKIEKSAISEIDLMLSETVEPFNPDKDPFDSTLDDE